MEDYIAIVGLDAVFPGDADTPEAFYELLVNGRSARTEIPEERYDSGAYWHPATGRHGTSRARHGHFLKKDVTAFDAPFFSITAEEAASMDPQQRGVLEGTYRALENAGISMGAVAGTQTGVYVGCFMYDYASYLKHDIDSRTRFSGLGATASILSNRISWFYDFKGPSFTVDTACSSSLVAAHQACVDLRAGETDMAVAVGCNLILSPDSALELDALGVLSPDGVSYSFDARANGYSRGEGIGVVVMKRLSDAVQDGNTIRAVVRGSAINQDGRSPGITQPTKAAQVALIKHVYAKAKLDLSQTRFFEAHGTGTNIGDPIEASAIGEVFGPHRSPENPLYVGALKSNVGHLEGAAGIAGIIKGVLTLERGVIPANAWFETRNPAISDSWNLEFPTRACVWPRTGDGLRRMSLNSFGFGGTNAHMILDDALHVLRQHNLSGAHRTVEFPGFWRSRHPSPTFHDIDSGLGSPESSNFSDAGSEKHFEDGAGFRTQSPVVTGPMAGAYNTGQPAAASRMSSALHFALSKERKPLVFAWSSFDKDGIVRIKQAYQSYLASKRSLELSKIEEFCFLRDLSYTLAAHRTSHGWRSFIQASSLDELQQALSEDIPPLISRAQASPKIGFVFTGQGAQWPAMGKELLVYLAFRKSLYDADLYLHSLGCEWSLLYELMKEGPSSNIDDPAYCQPICTALQIALVDLLGTWGVYPDSVIGHSSGEIAAAYAAGHLSQSAALRVSYYRGMLSSNLCRTDAEARTTMAAVGLDFDGCRHYMAEIEALNLNFGTEGGLDIACMNSRESHTISGTVEEIDALVQRLGNEGVFARKLNVGIGYHSRFMKPIAEEYAALVGSLDDEPRQASVAVRFFSSTHGSVISSPSELQQADYWVKNLVSPVRFHQAASLMLTRESDDTLAAGAPSDLLEIGPHATLKGPLRSIIQDQASKVSPAYQSVLTRYQSATSTSLDVVAGLFCRGHDVDLVSINQTQSSLMLTDLPSYPFNHSKSFWSESPQGLLFRNPPSGRLDLVGRPLTNNTGTEAQLAWRNWVRITENPWLLDHQVAGDILYPAAGMLVMAIEAFHQLHHGSNNSIKSFRLKEVSIHMALRIPDTSEGVETYFCLRPSRQAGFGNRSPWLEFQLHSRESNQASWTEHCRGLIQAEYDAEPDAVDGGHDESMFHTIIRGEVQSTRDICFRKHTDRQVYNAMRKMGLYFGPTFRNITEVSLDMANLMKAYASVRNALPHIEDSMPYHYVQPHMVHPVTLDGIFQVGLMPLVLAMDTPKHPTVPTFVEELWISASTRTNASYKVASSVTAEQPHYRTLCINAVDEYTGQPMVQARIRAKPLTGTAANVDLLETKPVAFTTEWTTDPTFWGPAEVDRLFASASQEAQEDVAADEAFGKDMNVLCLLYLRRLLASVAASQTSDLAPHHQHYLEWARRACQDNNSDRDLEGDIETRMLATGTPDVRLISAVGEALPSIIRGEKDALEVLFKDKLADEVYRKAFGAPNIYRRICRYVDALAHANPSMRIIELGAGTGGATAPIIETLTEGGACRFEQYDFTDISPSFFEEAQAKLGGAAVQGRMAFRVLNVEHDPEAQGFATGAYDVVVAANVVHATQSLETTLKHARALLKPGGRLLLYEITDNVSVTPGFCFGVFQGWWLSHEAERVGGPLLPVDAWERYIKAAGFAGITAAFTYQICSFMVASNPPAPAVPLLGKQTAIVVQDGSFSQRNVAELIRQHVEVETAYKVLSLSEAIGVDLTGHSCILLLDMETKEAVLRGMSQELLSALQTALRGSENIVWVSQGADQNPDKELVTGLGRVLRSENPNRRFLTVSLEASTRAEGAAASVTRIVHTWSDGQQDNAFRVLVDGTVQVPRVVEERKLGAHLRAELQAQRQPALGLLADHAARDLELRAGTPGLLDTLRFAEDPSGRGRDALGAHEIEFRAMAVGVNFKDLAGALGKGDGVMTGLEAAGVVTRVGAAVDSLQAGDAVFGIAYARGELGGAFKPYVRSTVGFLSQVPPYMSWTEAAAIPLVYATAYGILCENTALRRGSSLLVHAATGGFGQAAIQIAQLHGAVVFATVGSTEKRNFLETTYGIPREHIFSSRNATFKPELLRATDGRGVDTALNSLSGDGMQATWDCVAPFGRFVEVGMGDVAANAPLDLGNFARATRFEAFDFIYFCRHDPQRAQAIFRGAVTLALGDLAVARHATPITVYPMSKVEAAFRYMQSAKHIGKLVLEHREGDVVPILGRPSGKPAWAFDGEASYVITGGLGGLGKAVARWMVSRGARNLILLSRSGAASKADSAQFVQELEGQGVVVAAPSCDIANREMLGETIRACLQDGQMPPIKGCFQGAMVLKDNLFLNMTLEEWHAALRPKVDGSWNLHHVLGDGLDFFVFLSSACGTIGHREQSNYAAGNTFQDALAAHRLARGLPAVAIDLPPVTDVGFVAERPELTEALRGTGLNPIAPAELWAVLDYYCDPAARSQPVPGGNAQSSSSHVALKLALPFELAAAGLPPPACHRDPLFSHLANMGNGGAGGATAASAKAAAAAASKHSALLAAASSPEAARAVVLDALLLKLSRVLSIDPGQLEPAKPLHAMGIDSLVAVELRSWLAKALAVDMTVLDLTSKPSVYLLAEAAAARSAYTPACARS